MKQSVYESFWIDFLEKLNQKNSTIMNGRSPSKKHWQQTRGKVHLCASLRKNDSFVQLCIEKKDENENTEIFKKLLGLKNEIENRFGKKLNWDEKPGATRCTVTSKPLSLGISDIEKQEELLEQLAEDLIKLNSSLGPCYEWLEVNID
jgi:hypothetical protein